MIGISEIIAFFIGIILGKYWDKLQRIVNAIRKEIK
jgi:hypothetical protein